MTLFGLDITIKKKAIPPGLQIPESRGGWWPVIRESFTGAWQQNVETPLVDVLQHPTVFACVTLIAGDLKKMRYELARQEAQDVWVPTENPAFTPVLRTPNHYQDADQFREIWSISKSLSGNTYILKQRDQRGVVIALYVLDPWRVRPLVAPDGSVFYELKEDRLSQLPDGSVVVPAREMIHDRFNCFFHPLVGISPLYAAGIPAILGLRIETQSTHFFGNDSTPGGILTTPGMITKEKADLLKTQWEANYGGTNRGRVAILGDGMKFETITMPADKSQLNEQWLSAAEAIAVCFHVPFYLVGGPMPPYNNIQALNVQYYTQCLQPLATAIEKGLDSGLGLVERINSVQYGVQFKTKDLLLMDSLTMMQTIQQGINAGVLKPNEGRSDLNLLPVDGGDTPYLQQQNFSLAALDRRDTADPVEAPPVVAPAPDEVPTDAQAATFRGILEKRLEQQRKAA